MASMDIDDLIESFKSSTNVSQEASDLANLQAQLSSALMGARPAQCPTTPTMSSRQLPSDQLAYYAQASFSGQQQPQYPQKRERKGTMAPSRPSMSRRGSEWERQRQSELEEEMMVENSLLLDGPEAGYYHQQQQPQPQPQQAYGSYWVNSSPSPSPSPPVSEASSYEAYAAVDPFFAAQLQKAQNPYGQPFAAGYGFAAPRSTFASS